MVPVNSVQTASKRERATEKSGRSPVELILAGAKGGFVATAVMTAYRLPISRSLPPTDEFWDRFVRRGDSRSNVLPAIVLHFLYGSGAGAVYAVTAPQVSNTTEAGAEGWRIVTAVVYSVLLSVFGQKVLLEALLDQDLRSDERLVFHLGHVVYGLTLGTWLGSRLNG